MNASIQAISYYLPPRVLTNEEIHHEFPEWSVDRIAQKTGIVERRIADADTCSSDLGVESARRLFAEHNVDPASIDFLLLCTQSPDYFLPTTACLMQKRLGLPDSAGALDFNLGCSGFVYGLGLARGLLESGDASRVLLITAETYSKFLHPRDKSVRTIFGDGAAATLVTAATNGAALGPFVFGTDGAGAANLIVRTGGMRKARTDSDEDALFMDGAEVFNFTLKRVPAMVRALTARAGLTDSDIDLYVFHQANAYVLDVLRKKLGLSEEKFFICMSHCANTVSATIPIALADAIRDSRIKSGSTVLLAGFGVGYSWAGCIARF